MFANPLWSVLIVVALVLIYRFIISPRWKVRYADSYAYVHDFWARQWARIYAFRTPIVAALGPLLTALPDLLALIPNVDLSFLPSPWAGWANGAAAFGVIILKAYETTPREEPPKG